MRFHKVVKTPVNTPKTFHQVVAAPVNTPTSFHKVVDASVSIPTRLHKLVEAPVSVPTTLHKLVEALLRMFIQATEGEMVIFSQFRTLTAEMRRSTLGKIWCSATG